MECEIQENWRRKGVVIASSSMTRRNALVEVFRTSNVESLEVPDEVERNLWQQLEEAKACRVGNLAYVHEIATAKARWAVARVGVRKKLILAMDTVPLLVPNQDVSAGEKEIGQYLVLHKPKEEQLALQQLVIAFRSMIRGCRNKKGIESFSAVQRAASVVRVVTGMALYVPELHVIFQDSVCCDVSFGIIEDWIQDNEHDEAAEIKFVQALAKEVLAIQRASQKTPERIPGALDYGLMGTGTDLDQLLRWYVSDRSWGASEPKGVFVGAPKEMLEFMLNHGAHQIANLVIQHQMMHHFEEMDARK